MAFSLNISFSFLKELKVSDYLLTGKETKGHWKQMIHTHILTLNSA
jgi:hypothetical protein